MIKDDLIFEWSDVPGNQGRRLLALVLVTLFFTFFGIMMNVRFDAPGVSSVRSASVLFLDGDIGREWRLRAEEEGPFPGRLEIGGESGPLDLRSAMNAEGSEEWNDYTIRMRPMRSDVGESSDRIASKGLRYFPERQPVAREVRTPDSSELVRSPVLIPYSTEAQQWLPADLPLFRLQSEEGLVSASWRFILNLRADGTVAQCLSLSGGNEASLMAMIKWLEGLRFKESGAEERWMGLRVEFLNERKDGPDTQ